MLESPNNGVRKGRSVLIWPSGPRGGAHPVTVDLDDAKAGICSHQIEARVPNAESKERSANLFDGFAKLRRRTKILSYAGEHLPIRFTHAARGKRPGAENYAGKCFDLVSRRVSVRKLHKMIEAGFEVRWEWLLRA